MASKLVFIDDSSVILKTLDLILKDLVEEENIEYKTFNDPFELLDQLESGELDFDLLFVDIYMPTLDGYELTKKIREMERHKYKPIIALTTEVSKDSKVKGKSAGLNGWITKISSPTIMKDAIVNVLDKFCSKR
jgi:CheY-like chemotaxis protein